MKNEGALLVTGGAGFIGSHLAAKLIADGHRVAVVDDLSTGREENVPPGATFLRLDLGSVESMEALGGLGPIRAVLHLAGQSSGEASFLDPYGDLRSHALSTFGLMQWCRLRGVRRFLYASSMSTYGDPLRMPVDEDHPQNPRTYYGAGKLAAEAYLRLGMTLGLDVTILRLFSVYGPGQNMDNRMQGMVSIFLAYLLDGDPIPVKGAAQRFRDFVHVDDVVDAWVRALDDERSFGRTYNVSTGVKTTVRSLVDGLRRAAGLPKHPVVYSGTTAGDQFGMVGDSSRLRRDLGWKPGVTLRVGLTQMVASERERRARAR